jgi:acyl dehydratase
MDLRNYLNTRLDPGAPLLISQKLINQFGKVTGDDQAIHCDRNYPGGTIAQGGLLIGLLPQWMGGICPAGIKWSVNRGYKDLQFCHPVHSGHSAYLQGVVSAVRHLRGGAYFIEISFEIRIKETQQVAVKGLWNIVAHTDEVVPEVATHAAPGASLYKSASL